MALVHHKRRLLTGTIVSAVLAAYPVLIIAVASSGQARTTSIAAAVTATAVAGVLLFALLYHFSKSIEVATTAAAFTVGLFYLYGPAHAWIEVALLDQLSGRGENVVFSFVVRYLHVLLTVAFLHFAWVVAVRLKRASTGMRHQLFRGLSIMSIALVAMLGVQVAARADQLFRTGRSHAEGQQPSEALADYSDVYLIVLDGYARADHLLEYYNFDNGRFLADLRERGFMVADQSTSNYHWTFLSLASLLNMDYVQDVLAGRISSEQTGRGAAYGAIRDSRVHRLLRSKGYRTVHFQSTWGATLENPFADVEVRCTETLFQDEFVRTLVEASWLKVLQPRAAADLAECYKSNLNKLHLYAGEEQPTFVFAHFLPPHHPYLFDESGNVLRSATLANQFEFQKRLWEERGLYLGQLKFMNRSILQAIDRVLARSDRHPIIVLLSDHGPNISEGMTTEEISRVRFSNLVAVMAPDSERAPIPSDVALVNLFRHILSDYFNEAISPLPVMHYTSPYARPYAFRRENVHESQKD